MAGGQQAGGTGGARQIRSPVKDGELCGVRPDGITSFSMIQAASDSGNAAALVFFLFDLLYLDGEDLCARPLQERKAGLPAQLSVEACTKTSLPLRSRPIKPYPRVVLLLKLRTRSST
jgi:ATP-dependent DNA ligase